MRFGKDGVIKKRDQGLPRRDQNKPGKSDHRQEAEQSQTVGAQTEEGGGETLITQYTPRIILTSLICDSARGKSFPTVK